METDTKKDYVDAYINRDDAFVDTLNFPIS